MHWYWSYGVLYWIAMAGSLLFLLAPFLGRMRFSSTAVRVQLFLLGVALLLWSGVGWYVFFRGADWLAAQTHFLHHVKSLLAGIAMGLFASVVVNRDFYARSRHLSSDI